MQGLYSCAGLLTAVKDLVLIPVHTVPEDAEKELDELFDVVTEVSREWETDVSCSFLYFSVSGTL